MLKKLSLLSVMLVAVASMLCSAAVAQMQAKGGTFEAGKGTFLLNGKPFVVTFTRKDNSLRINRLFGLLENWVTR